MTPICLLLSFSPWHSWSYFKRFEANSSKISNKWHSILSTQLDTYASAQRCWCSACTEASVLLYLSCRGVFPSPLFLCASWILSVFVCLGLFLGRAFSVFSCCSVPIEEGPQWGHLPQLSSLTDKWLDLALILVLPCFIFECYVLALFSFHIC